MVRVALIAAVAACGSATHTPPPPPPAPAAPAPAASSQASDTPWDHGTFIDVDKEKISPDTEERFDIYRTAAGYRIVVQWKRPLPTGEPTDGKVTLELDPHWAVVAGEMEATIHQKSRDDVTRSRIIREPDGRLATEVTAADGSKTTNASQKPNDWYIGGTTTTFLAAMCQLDATAPSPVVYPDKLTVLQPPQPMPIPETARAVTYRKLVYQGSGHEVVAACEGGKLAGEVTRGVTIVRSGDLALARVLESRFR